MCVDVEPGMRTAAAVAWEAVTKISMLVLALSILDRGCCSSVTRCIAAAPGAAAARAVAAGVAAAREGGPQEAIRPSRWWSRIVSVVGTGDLLFMCLMGRKQLSHGIQTGKNNEKPTTTAKKSRQPMQMYLLVWDNTWAGPQNPRAGPRNCRAGPYRARVS